MTAVDMVGYAGVVVNIGVYLMRTMIPLRIFALATNILFITYAFFADVYPTLLLNCILLPLNGYRLAEMLSLIRKTRVAVSDTHFDMDFLRPYTRKKAVAAGETLFRKDDKADSMFLIESGSFTLVESGIVLSHGAIVGELGLLAPGGARTQTLVANESGAVRQLDYEQFKQIYFQNPKFGFYFLQLTTGRLFENINALERALIARGLPNPLDQDAASLVR